MKTITTSAMTLMLALLTSTTLLAQNETGHSIAGEPIAFVTTPHQVADLNAQPEATATPKTFGIGLYRVQQSMTMRLTMEKKAGERVNVRLLNDKGQMLHQEVVGRSAKKYACNFDFANTQDGRYTIEVANGSEVLTKAINLTTHQVVETPARTLIAQN